MLYSNIGHEQGVCCIEDAVSFILNNNYFEYAGAVYHQTKGTAMGTRMAPSYTNLFMGSVESKFLTSSHPFSSKVKLFKRFIDDHFFLWEGDEADGRDFTDFLNKNPLGMKFTSNFGRDAIDFLDLIISYKN